MSDAEFLRRVSLDFAGKIPTVVEARQFLADKNAEKRTKLIDALIAALLVKVHRADFAARDFHAILLRELRGSREDSNGHLASFWFRGPTDFRLLRSGGRKFRDDEAVADVELIEGHQPRVASMPGAVGGQQLFTHGWPDRVGVGVVEVAAGGEDLAAGADRLEAFLTALGVSTRATDYGVTREDWIGAIDDALLGERGRNFIGSREAVLAAAA